MPSDVSAVNAQQRRPNAADYFVQENLSDGSAITIRAIRPDDKQRIASAFQALEPRSIYSRFLYAKKALSDDELRRLTEIDYVEAIVLVAIIQRQNDEIIIGLGRYARSGDSAEVAFTVEEDYQGRGIAGRLLHHLARSARENGVLYIEAEVLAENMPMLAVFRDSGLAMTTRYTDDTVHVTLSLDGSPDVP